MKQFIDQYERILRLRAKYGRLEIFLASVTTTGMVLLIVFLARGLLPFNCSS